MKNHPRFVFGDIEGRDSISIFKRCMMSRKSLRSAMTFCDPVYLIGK